MSNIRRISQKYSLGIFKENDIIRKKEIMMEFLDKDERELYEKRLETLRDEQALLQQAEETGIEKGKEIGLAEGKEIGRTEGKEELLTHQILRALQRGRDKEFIMEEYECSEELYQKALENIQKEKEQNNNS